MDDGSLEYQYRQEVYERMCAVTEEFGRIAETLLMLNATGTLLAAVDRRAAIRYIAIIDRYLAATEEVVSAAVEMSPEDVRSFDEQTERAEYMRKMLEQAALSAP